MNKRINPAVLPPLKEPLTLAFWYKKDLRPFLSSALNDAGLGAQLDWTDYKRNIVHQLVDGLAANQHRRLDQLVNLILAVPPHREPPKTCFACSNAKLRRRTGIEPARPLSGSR